MSVLEDQLAQQFDLAGIVYVRQFKFHPKRRWLLDFAWPEHLLALEVEGGLWSRGDSGHKHPTGIIRDIEKGNELVMMGWRLLRVHTDMVMNGEALYLVQVALGLEKKWL